MDFRKTFDMLNPGGYLAMFMTRSDERTLNEDLGDEIEKAYEQYFHVEQRYTCKLDYNNVVNYGFRIVMYNEWKSIRIWNAVEYISYISTHCEHIPLYLAQKPYDT